MRLGLLCTLIWIFTLASADAQDYPPIGKLIDVGGYRVHLYCIGSGSPAVVIVGAGYSFDWALVQPDVSKFTQVCAYDHSGIAWSDPGPTDSCSLRVKEIHSALTNAKISGPFVLVGHSHGALVARLYAAKYADEAAGMVIVGHAGPIPTNSQQNAAPPTPSIGSNNVPATVPDPTPFQKLPAVDYQLHLWANSLPGVSKTMWRNLATIPQCSSDVEAATADKAVPFSDKPLIVLTNGMGVTTADSSTGPLRFWQPSVNSMPGYAELMKTLLSLSTNSKAVVAENSGHFIMVDRPDLVITAIREVVEAVRHHTKLNH